MSDVVDARGLRCPLPVIHLGRRVVDAAPGEVLEVWATDPAAASDIPAWCRMRGHDYLGAQVREATDDGGAGHTAYLIRLADDPQRPPAAGAGPRS